ncbi:MAG: tyrosine-type recombinase/integrase [Eubacteriales bacterium]|nr:tyrosine-type recombinase/integrase [Eubacteriales bacterium]
MTAKRRHIPQYGTVEINGHTYYRTIITNAEGNRVPLYAKTREELYDKEMEALERNDNSALRRKSPTVAEYCEKWLLLQSVHVRKTTLTDYTSKVRRHIISELGDMRMADVTLDDIQVALVPVSKKSVSVYKSVIILYKSIFRAAKESRIIDNNPTIYLSAKGGGVPQKDKTALTDEQVKMLLDTVKGLPPYVFVMLGLYAGLRREEILALQWDSVYLDADAPYLTVRRAWHTENNRPVVLTELKTKAAERNIPLPDCLAECLREAKAISQSEYVVANSEGQPLSYTQFRQLWKYIVTRTAKPRTYRVYKDNKVVHDENGKPVKRTIYPKMGEKAAHNGNVVYSLDFDVTPHQLRHTYITNLIAASVDPKTVQYLAGHESSKITMDIYAKVKYNRPEELVQTMDNAFAQWETV